MLTRSFSFSYSGGETLTRRVDVQTGAETIFSENIPAASSGLAIPTAKLTVAQLKSVFLVSEKALVLRTNSNGSPANIFTLQAGVPFIWLAGGDVLRDTAGAAVTVDITALYATNGGAADTIFEGRFGFDPTP